VHLRFEQIVPVRRELLFAFHEDPRNLALLFRGSRRFRLLAHAGHIRPGAVTRVEYALHPLLPVAMAFEHDLCEPPLRFGELARGAAALVDMQRTLETRGKPRRGAATGVAPCRQMGARS